MIEIPVHDRHGKVVDKVQFDDSCLGRAVRVRLLHQAILAHEANQRVGSAKTKTRREVMGATGKPWRQKGTGRARAGSRRSPLWRGGGVTFGPAPRDYHKKLSKKARRAALRSALLAKLRDGEIKVVTDLDQDAPKTRELAAVLKALGVQQSCLIVIRTPDEATWKSARNLQMVDLLPLRELNAYFALRRRMIVMTKDALAALPEELQ